MKKYKKILAILLAVLMMVAMVPTNANAVDNYNTNDFSKLQTFLNSPSSNPDKTNGQQINPAYNANDATTWLGVEWNNDSPKRVFQIGHYDTWFNKSLAGTLDLSGCSELAFISCEKNKLTGLNLNGTENLTYLYCSYNNLTSLDVSNLPVFYDLDCEYNQLVTLNVGTNSTLVRLKCNNNNLITLNLIGANAMERLYCANNKLTLLNLAGVDNLSVLSCETNQLTSLDISEAGYIDSIDCSENKLSQINTTIMGCDIKLSRIGNGNVELNYSNYSDMYLYSIESFSMENGIYAIAVPNTGAKFDGWTLVDNTEWSSEEPILQLYDTSYNLVAHFSGTSTGDTYTVNFDENGGTREEGGELRQEVEYGGFAIEPKVSRSGYNFIGWDTSFSNITENITVTAIWSIAVSGVPVPVVPPEAMPNLRFVYPYNVTFDLKGGTRTGGGEEKQYIDEGKAAVEPTVTRDGYTFLGWDVTFDKIVMDTVITAKWEKIIIYHTVTFDLFGGTHTGGGELIQDVVEGTGAIEPTTTLEGYTLVGWDFDFVDVLEDMTITADWSENATTPEQVKYSIIYDANGGKGTVPIDSNEYVEGTTATLADGSALSKKGYQFAGWSFTSEGEAITDTEVFVNEDVTLYAVWEAVETTEEIVEDSIPKTGNPSGAFLASIMLLFGSGIVAIEHLRKRKTVNN